MPTYPMPYCRVEIALQSVVEGRLSTLFTRREEAPFEDCWGLPGGVLRVEEDFDLDAAAERIARERLGCSLPNLQQIRAVGAMGRDPRGKNGWGLSVVFRSLTPATALDLSPGKRIEGFMWVDPDQEPQDDKFAFDHLAIAAQAAKATRAEIAGLRFPPGYAPEKFTLSQLQDHCEQVLGTRLDKSSFRRKLAERHLVEPVEGEFTTGVKNRPAAIYRLNKMASTERTE